MNQRPWWSDAVVYQVYVRSFADSDGDGIGDLRGVLDRLPYLRSLGVDAIWLNPCYPSPQADHGYDVADYRDINREYGDLALFDALVARAHELGIRVLMDLVPNHCSAEHPWFREALAAPPGSPARKRFLFRDGRGDLPPNNWRSQFGGSAWTRVTGPDGTPGQWYLHMFDPGQPDFDWRNPDVVAMFDDVLRFWFGRGVDGFRIDVAHGLLKRADLLDWTGGDYNGHAWNQPDVHEVYRRWHRIADECGTDGSILLVGEVWVPTADDLAAYLRPDELSQAFYFDLLMQPWSAAAIRGSLDRARDRIEITGAVPTWTLANHDVHRSVSRYGIVRGDLDGGIRPRGEVDVALGLARARAALLLVLALPGAVYLYQGEELGLPEVLDLPDDRRRDPAFSRSGGTDKGRDGCRVPLPWTSGGESFGFSPPGATGRPWLPQPDWFGDYAADRQATDPESTLGLHQQALALRRKVFRPADPMPSHWTALDGEPDVLAFRRGGVMCVVNFGATPVTLPDDWGTPILASARVSGRDLPGNAAAWLAA